MFEVNSQNVERENFDTQNIFDPSQILLPPMSKWLERTIVLDLDNTLVNATLSRPSKYDFTISVEHSDEKTLTYYVQRRFGINLLFFYLKIYKYEIIIFTSASKEYTDAILKGFNMDGGVDHCLYRDSCSSVLGRWVKDLRKLGRDMKKVFLADDCPDSYQLHPENGFLVKPFLGSSHDRELMRVVDVARRAAQCEDVREALIHCSEIERVTAGKQERENVTPREQESEGSKKGVDMAQPTDRERESPEVGVCRNQSKGKVKQYSKLGVGRFQPKELASKNSKDSKNMAKFKEKKGVILKAAGKRVQRREQ
ncbi:hypothetical protein SUGI_0248070 [Cryptomeria japonica]|uniref:uncharacterized protein LOC131874138 n=1 Tax=Cryptomeria japonica TaxID=3369 RepID=UPI002408954C|nr:uncharacterized protein LOC131874138 [Cryptomeria japonica]GLJ15173.1 hypothetical protein SUGI_0248070 [Cryptomeria japonica]